MPATRSQWRILTSRHARGPSAPRPNENAGGAVMPPATSEQYSKLVPDGPSSGQVLE